MNSVAKRKIILLSVIAFLAIVYVVLLAVDSKSSVSTVSYDGAIDVIRVENGAASSGAVTLEKKDGSWLVSSASGATAYAADESVVDGLVSALKELKLLGTVTGNPSSDADRYGLDENARICVTAEAGGKTVRRLVVGKNTSTSNQCYVQLDGKNTVYLEDSPLHSTFSCTVDSLRSKSVYKLDSSAVMAVKVSAPDGTGYVVARNTAPVVGEDSASQPVWVLAESTPASPAKLDDSKVSSWINSIASLSVSAWNADGEKIPESAPVTKVEITGTSGTYIVNVTEAQADAEQIQCASSVTPYTFTVGKYVAQRYTKKLSDLTAK